MQLYRILFTILMAVYTVDLIRNEGMTYWDGALFVLIIWFGLGIRRKYKKLEKIEAAVSELKDAPK